MGGKERARALARLYHLVDTLYERRVQRLVTSGMLKLLDDPTHRPPTALAPKVSQWVNIHMRHTVINAKFSDPKEQAIVHVLLLVDLQTSSSLILTRQIIW